MYVWLGSSLENVDCIVFKKLSSKSYRNTLATLCIECFDVDCAADIFLLSPIFSVGETGGNCNTSQL